MAVTTTRPVPGFILKTIPTVVGNGNIRLLFSERFGKVLASLIGTKGPVFIKPENMPKELRQIKSSSHFENFFRDVFGQTQLLSNGEHYLSIHHRIRAGGGQTVVDLAEDPNLVDKTMAIVRPGLNDLLNVKIKEKVVLLVGRTGAGKSLLGNLLAGVDLQGVGVNLDFRLEPVDPKKAFFKISHSIESCTGIPNVYSPPMRDFSYIDFPGFDDTHFPEQDIANLFFRKEVLKNVKEMKLVLVVDWTDIDRKGTYLPNTFNDLLQFLGYENIQDERLATLAESIILVVTHTPPLENKAIREKVGKALKEYVASPYGLKDNAKAILGEILEVEFADKTGRWATFSSPSQAGTVPKVDGDRKEIAALLHDQKSKYISISDTTIQAKVNVKYEGMVQNGLRSLITDLKRGFAGKVLSEVSAYLQRFYTRVAGKSALREFQKKYHEIIASKAPRTLFELLKELQFSSDMFAYGLLEEAKRQDESIKFLVDLLPNKIASQMPYKRDWVEELGLRKTLLEWDKTVTETTADSLLSVSSTADSKVKLSLQGYFPRLSQITNVIGNYQAVSEVEIHALHTVLIDADLGGDKMRGVDVTIIAPKWEVPNKQTINLTGKNSGHSYNSRAQDGQSPGEAGTDGLPGQPGENGGHFFGFGLAFSGIENLTVVSKGGKGGRGQDGGAGHPGNDGEDGVVRADFSMSVDEAHNGAQGKRDLWERFQHPPDKTGDIGYDQELLNRGKAGGKGGNGGRAGIGGNGGQPGSVEFISLDKTTLTIPTKRENGPEGEAGAVGNKGIGGRKGRDWGGVWHTERRGFSLRSYDYPDSSWNGFNGPRFRPENRDESTRVNGTEPTDKNSNGRAGQQPLSPFNAMEHLYRYREFAIQASNPLTLQSIEIFRKLYDQHATIVGKESVDNFIAECDRMEDFFTSAKDKTICLPFYHWMGDRIRAYQVPNGNPALAALLQCLYTYTLSKICQLNAAADSRLIVDIKGFLAGVEKNVNALRQQDQIVKINFYEAEYTGYLKGKIGEADHLIDKLRDDIKAADKEIDAQIKVLLKEIQDLKAKNSANQSDLKAKRDKLRAELEKRKILGFVSIAVQAIGCCFPPAGPIVAGIVGVGLTALGNNSRAALAGLGGAISVYGEGISAVIQDSKATLSPFHTMALTRLRDVTVTAALLDVIDNPAKTEEQQIEAMDKAIAEIDKQQNQLDTYREGVNANLAPTLHELVDGASKAQQALQGKSKISLEFSRLAIKRAFEAVNRQIKGSTKSFASQEGFLTIIQQLEEAIQTTANIYEYVQENEEQIMLGSYLARLAAPTAQDPRIEVYKQKVFRNLTLEQYARAVAAVRQWAFPFTMAYLGDLAVLDPFADAHTMDSLIDVVVRHLGLLQAKVEGRSVETNSSIDTYLWRGGFSNEVTVGPFYIWTCKEHTIEITDLLKGKQVVFFADVNRTVEEMSAIKFNQIELQIKSTNPILQAKLRKALQGITVEMQHSGLSYYKYEGEIYQMSNDNGFCIAYKWGAPGADPEAENQVYTKMKEGDFMLSPYTSWAITLKGADGLHDLIANKLDTIQVSLVGRGQYVIAKNATGKVKGLEAYTEIRVSGGTTPGVIPQFKSRAQQGERGQQRVDDNASAQKDNPQYLYQATDISFIVQSQTISTELANFHFIQGMQAGHLTRQVDHLIDSVNGGKPVLCVFNISDVHWVTLCLLNDAEGQLLVLYKDSFGGGNTDLSNLLVGKVGEFKSHPEAEQVGDSTSCGILAFENMRIMAREINKDRDRFIREFESQVFCPLSTAKTLRKVDYPRFYMEGVQESERLALAQAARSTQLAAAHQSEVNQIIAELRANVATGITVQTEDARADTTGTIVVQIGANDSHSNDYHYRIVGKGIDEAEIEVILSQNFGWFRGDDYQLENGVFKVSKKLATAA